MLHWLKENTVTIQQAEEMSDEALEGKIITGVYVNKPRKEFVEAMEDVMRERFDVNPDDNINKAYKK